VPSLAHAVRTKGLRKTARRALTLAARYGVTSGPMERNLRRLAALLAAQGVRGTLPVTAVPLRRHAAFLRDLSDQGIELALHGYIHCDYASASSQRRRDHLVKGLGAFREAGLPPPGFRAPYLSWPEDGDGLLGSLGFPYNSSRTVHWPVLPPAEQNGAYALALEHYRPRAGGESPCLPRLEDGLVDLPVSLPDDEMLIERLGLRDQGRIFSIWNAILQRTVHRGELFVLQLHPERIPFADQALVRLLREAKARGAWVAPLMEIARWWSRHEGRWPDGHPSAVAVTGDIDAMSLWDYAAMRWGADG